MLSNVGLSAQKADICRALKKEKHSELESVQTHTKKFNISLKYFQLCLLFLLQAPEKAEKETENKKKKLPSKDTSLKGGG